MIVYKYADDFGLKILEDLRLKITPPNEFNDPFEITPLSRRARPLPEMIKDATIESPYFRAVYEDMVHDGAYSGSFEQFIRDMPTELPKHYPAYKKLSAKEMAVRDLTALDEVSPELGILCLSKPRDDIPMWSYYANEHRGIAVGLDPDRIGSLPEGPRGFVKYRKNRLRVNPFSKTFHKERLQTIFTKSFAWRHEQEYRRVFRLGDLVSPTAGPDGIQRYFLDISSDAIREVILGCRINPDFKNKIRAELARRKRTFGHVRLFRCQRHPSRFELKIVSVEGEPGSPNPSIQQYSERSDG